MTTCLYARQTPAWAKWARAHVRDTETVEDADAIRGAPDGATWVCPPQREAELREALAAEGREAASVIVLDLPDAPPWGSLAHDLRGPLGVIEGTLSEVGEDPLVAIARRSTAQLVHTATLWEALGADPGPANEAETLTSIANRARATFEKLEPRRADRVQLTVDEGPCGFDPARLELALIQLFAHLVRASPTPVTMTLSCEDGAATIRVEGERDLEMPRAGEPGIDVWSRSSRLGAAVAILAAIDGTWERTERGGTWRGPTP